MLTTTEIADRYPVPNVNNYGCWRRLLNRWRQSKKLQEGKHFRVRACDRRQRPATEYEERRVLVLVCQSDMPFACSVRTVHREAILERVGREKV